MDGNIESESEKAGESEPVNLREHRQRGDLGVELFTKELEKRLSFRQRLQRLGVHKRIQKIIHDPNSADPLQDIVDYARGLGDNTMVLLAFSMFSREFVNSTQTDKSSRDKDRMAGKMFDGLAERLLKTPPQK